jgi:hypothetical protein
MRAKQQPWGWHHDRVPRRGRWRRDLKDASGGGEEGRDHWHEDGTTSAGWRRPKPRGVREESSGRQRGEGNHARPRGGRDHQCDEVEEEAVASPGAYSMVHDRRTEGWESRDRRIGEGRRRGRRWVRRHRTGGGGKRAPPSQHRLPGTTVAPTPKVR